MKITTTIRLCRIKPDKEAEPVRHYNQGSQL